MKEETPGSSDLVITPVPSLTCLTINQLTAIGVSRPTAYRKLSSGEWKACQTSPCSKGNRTRKILISSLPVELQLKWLQQNFFCQDSDQPSCVFDGNEKKLSIALLRFAPSERGIWLTEAMRLLKIVMRYDAIKVKRQRSSTTGKYEYVKEVHDLCREAACKDQRIVDREPHRATTPTPHTLHGWSCTCERFGLLTFLRYNKSACPARANKVDKRRVAIQLEAVEWINSNWQKSSGSRHLYKAYKREAKLRHWKVPSESWFFRLWRDVPEVVKVLRLEGHKAYESKLAPYVPRDYSDLHALQILCGDHSERDVTVCLADGTISRAWVTIWYDLRTGLIWGWHISLSPSSYTAGLAYADGVRNFGAQPFSRPDDGFFSYIYTDRGRDYRSHNWDGKVIFVHKEALKLDGGFEVLRIQQRVGIIEELTLKHLLTRSKNPKENPVERVHGIISEWERNTFEAYCGRNPSSRPEKWRKLYVQHQKFNRGKCDSSPFPSLNEYREKFAEFVTLFNTTSHMRTTLDGRWVVPVEEFNRLYTTRYKIDEGTLALILMKPKSRRINRDGVQLFQKNWNYLHEAMLRFIGAKVEVRYSDGDYNSVFVILPNKQICEARRLNPSSIINPNKQTLAAIAKAKAHEKKINDEFYFIAQSRLRGETTEDRIAQEFKADEFAPDREEERQKATPYKINRMSGAKLRQVSGGKNVVASDVAKAELDTSMFEVPTLGRVSEFDYDD